MPEEKEKNVLEPEEKVEETIEPEAVEPEEKVEAAAEPEVVEPELVIDADDDDDFADAHPIVPEPVEEPKEEAPEEPVVDPQEEEVPLTEEEEPEGFEPKPELATEPDLEYDDANLTAIEEARKVWNHYNKVSNRVKFAYSTIILLGILAGWLIPTLLQVSSALIIGLCCAVGGIVILAVVGIIRQRAAKKVVRDYFNSFYTAINNYTLGAIGIDDIQGDIDSKVTSEEFLEGGAFDKVAQIGSRDNITFTYRGMDCALADAAGSIDAGKSLQTIFVGKYLRTHNTLELSDEGLLIYFSGNDRALPPEKMNRLHLCERTKRYKVYGASSDKKVLTKKIRDGLARIRTDKLLVDVTIVIKPGRTYWYLGYEDDIMVLPNDKPFDARFMKEYKWQIAEFLEIARLMNE